MLAGTSQPGTGQPVTSHPVSGHPVPSHPVTSQPGTRQLFTGHIITWQLFTRHSHRVLVISHPGTGHYVGFLLTGYQSLVSGQPVTAYSLRDQPNKWVQVIK